MTRKTIMLSIHPKFAEKIFNGQKCVELRRNSPNLSSNDTVIIYVTSPIKQVWGASRIRSVVKLPLDALWEQVQNDACISKTDFDQYFSGVDEGFGIYLDQVQNASSPLDLSEIKKEWNNFCPPQSYRYVHTNEIDYFQNFIPLD